MEKKTAGLKRSCVVPRGPRRQVSDPASDKERIQTFVPLVGNPRQRDSKHGEMGGGTWESELSSTRLRIYSDLAVSPQLPHLQNEQVRVS